MRQPLAIDGALLDRITGEARLSPRRRKNYNFHASEADACNRILNAVEPGSYIRPHRHLDPSKDETLVMLRGRLGAVFFDDAGVVIGKLDLAPGAAAAGVHAPHGAFHTFLSLEPGTVFFETKAGPYVPLRPDELAPWAPAEGDPAAADYLAALERLFPSA